MAIETITTVKRIFNIPYKLIVKKIYWDVQNKPDKRISLITIDKYIFGIKVSNTKIVK